MTKKFSVDQWLDDIEFVEPQDHKRRRKDRVKNSALPMATITLDDNEWEYDELDQEKYHRRRKTRRVRRTVEVD
jgi:hypothetical protein